MAHSSPGHPRVLDSMNQLHIPESLRDFTGDGMHHNADSEPFFEQEQILATQPPVGKSGHDQQALGTQKEVISSSAADENSMLLKKPSFDRPDLENDKGYYQFGPAIQLAPDHFTKRPTKPAPLHQDGRPQKPRNKSTPRPNREGHNAGSDLAAMGAGTAENAVRSELPPSTILNRTGGNHLTTSQGFAENTNKFSGSIEAKKAPNMVGNPPFPDSPPKEAPRSTIHAQTRHTDTKSPTSPSDGQTWTPKFVLTPANVNRPTTSPGHHSSEHISHHGALDAARYHQLPRHDQQTPPGNTGKTESTHNHQHYPVRHIGDSRGSVGDAADRSRNRIVNRPLKEMAYGRPAKPAYRPRPESRSSNVSKQRCVPNPSYLVLREANPRTDPGMDH
jgi:hypothetical protein